MIVSSLMDHSLRVMKFKSIYFSLLRIPFSLLAHEEQMLCNALLMYFLQNCEILFAGSGNHFSVTQASDPQVRRFQ